MIYNHIVTWTAFAIPAMFLKLRHLPDLPIPTKRGNSGKEAKEREDCGGKGADKPRQGWTNSVVTSFHFGARSGDN